MPYRSTTDVGSWCSHDRLRRGGVKSQSFPGNRLAVLPGVERLRKWPKFALHGGTAALHRESQSPCSRAIMGQLAIGAGFHTFLRRAVFYLFLTHFPYAILMSFMT